MTGTKTVVLSRILPPPVLRRALREAAGLTQEDLAAALGVSRAALSRWETGSRKPRRYNQADYAAVLARLDEIAMPGNNK